MADESKRVTALSAGKLRRLMSRLTERQGTAAGIPRTPRGGALALSFAQERLWFLDRLGAGGAAYHIPAAVRLRGPLDASALERTLGALVDRHEALRTTFAEQDGGPVQLIHSEARLELPRVDLSALPQALRTGELARISRDEASRPFDLTRAPLLRTVLVRLGPGDHRLALTFHHIVTDGWSLGVLVREVAALYPGLAAGTRVALPELPVQPADHAAWEREQLHGGALKSELAFWREHLAGLPALELPADRPRPAHLSFRGALATLDLPGETARAVEALAQREGATPFMALLALFQALLLRYTGQSDFGVGTPVAHRTRSETEGLIGLFVNTLVLRADLSGRPGFAELLRRVRETTLAAFAHEELPFEKLVEELRPEREPGRNPLFQVLFTLHNQPWPKLRMGELDLELSEVDTGTARADLTLLWREREGGLTGTLEYSTDLFERASAERLLGHLAGLLHGALADPERTVRDLPLLTGAERRQILKEWRGQVAPYPREATVHELFAEQAAAAGGRVAVEAGDARLTYAELESRANQLARHLRRLGVGPDSLVGLAVPRSPERVVGLLGILKAGGAYLPLDPADPRERLALLADEARPRALVTLEPLLDRLPGGMATVCPVVCLDRDREALAAELRSAPAAGAAAGNLAYVLYTSGSTGQPKGVAVPHRGVVRLVRGAGFARLDAGQALLQLAPLSFDASTLEIWGALCNGARLVLAPPEPPSLAELGRLLTHHGVTTLWLTAGLFHQMVDEGIDGLRGLSQLLAGGDVLSPLHVHRALAALPGCTLVNGYGPTENTTFTCCHPLADASADAPVPIGRPIANTSVVLLDRAGNPVPVGVPGELYAGGDGLARGYLGRPDLTAERFVPSPLAGAADAAGARLYRTGDLARWRPDGKLDFLGRIDQQVKIRGFRIEPGEIEAVLAAHPGVAECAVVVQGGAGEDRRLIAWLAPREGAAPEPTELRSWLARRLPAYMVPSFFALLGSLPLTPNGKVDRRALARLQPPSLEIRGTEPETPLERLIAAVWSDLLGQPRIGRDDDFFALGGHSLLATRVVSRLREELGIELPLVTVFENPTLAGLAAAAGQEAGAAPGEGPLSAEAGDGPAPLSFSQERLWFLEQLRPGGATYNIPAAVRLAGSLDPAGLAACFGEIVRRHATLRTTFFAIDGEPRQQAAPAVPVLLPRVDLGALPEEARSREARRLAAAEAAAPFGLAAGPLLRTTLLRLGPDEHLLLLTIHHIVADGWSVGILVREIAALYTANALGQPSPLPELPVQYADFALWQRRRLTGATLAGELDFWREHLHGAPPELALPTDRPRPAAPSGRATTWPLRLSGELAEGVRHLARSAGATPFMVLLAAFEALLSRLSDQTDLTVGTSAAGRQRTEVEGLIGFFVNTLVLRADLAGEPSFDGLLSRTRRQALAAFAHQDLPFEKLVELFQPGRNLGQTPLFQAFFALQNAPPEPLRLPGLTVEPLPEEAGAAKFDLTLALAEEGHGFTGVLAGSADLLEEATVRRWAEGFERLLAAALRDPGERVLELPLLGEAERRTILGEWSSAGWERPAPVLIHELFAEQVARTPGKVAAVCRGTALTYRELDERAGRLARRILSCEDRGLIGLMAAPDLPLLVGMLGILKAGRGFVPLDPGLPAERLERMIADCGLTVLAADRRSLARCPAVAHVICLDEELDALPPTSAAGAGDGTAYVIFTSGSTGVPKGVPITHENLVPLLLWSREVFGFGEHTRVLQSLSYAFDFGVFEILATLLFGGTIFLRGDAERSDAEGYLREVRAHAVNTLHTTPSFFRAVAAAAGTEGLPTVEVLHLGGEALTEALAQEAFRVTGPECRIFNGYGPTEAAVNCALYEVGRAADWRPRGLASLPIGHPSAANRLYVLDRRLQPVPAGVPGELLVGGPALSRGYLGQPDLTAARFLPDLFGEPGGRLYRTGDLVRFHGAGALEFLGRIDGQVKVRGHRIELAEIEAALAAHPEVGACAVVAVRQEGEARLVAYAAARGEQAPDVDELRRFLGRTLPAYMVPAAFVFLPELPLSVSGKVDRKALPAPGWTGGTAWAAPRTPTERRIAAVWSDLLGHERIGRDDDFFALGGHSLLATRVVSRLREELGVELPVIALFETPTLAGLAAAAEEAGISPDDGPVSSTEGTPLSFSQERIWFLEQLRPGSATYNVPAAVRLAGALDPAGLAACFGEIVRRHATLRTTFFAVDGEPRQQVAPAAGVALPRVDLAALPEEARHPEARRLAAAEAAAPFDLAAGPLLRTTLLRLREDEHLLLLTVHHIVADGWSVGILIREMGTLFAAHALGQPSPLPELPIQYADFALWQRRRLSGSSLEREIRFWSEHLRGAPAELALPADRPRSAMSGERGTSRRLRLSPELAAGVRALALRSGATPFMVLLAAFQTLLSRLSGQTGLTVGTPVAGRQRAKVEGLIGFFVNTLVLRADLADAPSFADLLARTRRHALAAYAHQDLPFEKLVEQLRTGRSPGHTPLFQAFFALQNAPVEPLCLPGLAAELLAEETRTAKFDLTLALGEDGDGFAGELIGNAGLFEEETIQRWAGGFERLLAAALKSPGESVFELPLLGEAERQAILGEWSSAGWEPPAAVLIHELFAEQVARTPGKAAAVCAGTALTYRELDEQAGRLASRILSFENRGLVGLMAMPDLPLLAGMLGILKAGCGFVPLDPDLPAERLERMIADCGLTVLAADRRSLARCPAVAHVICLDEELDALPPTSAAGAGDGTAYVIFTSGSTGVPKGVPITHQNLVPFLLWSREAFGFGEHTRVLQSLSYAFDFGVFEILSTLLFGGTLFLRGGAERSDLEGYSREVRAHAANTLHTTPSFFRAVAAAAGAAGLPTVEVLHLGGEALTEALVAEAFRVTGPECRLFNGYGPTEAAVNCALYEVGRAADWRPRGLASLPIGHPSAANRLYVLDRRLQPVPAGVSGELLVGGPALSRGYLGRPDLTAARFVPDPFGEPGGRLYRTGDLVRFHPDRAIEFLGRVDHQVKVRGYRIEPEEIEAALSAHPQVGACAVVAVRRDGGEARLLAYVSARRQPAPSAAELRRFLGGTLPAYMVPAAFTFLPELPLNVSGKVDRKALPAPGGPEGPNGNAAAEWVAPRTPLERRIAAVWSDLLEQPRIGRDDDFFALGGHSLLATRVVSRLRAELGVELPVLALFEAPTLAGLAAAIEETGAAPGDDPISAASGAPLSFSQERLWFLEQLRPGSATYNLPAAVRLAGALDPAGLAACFGEIVRRHATLRATFPEAGGEPRQRITAPAGVDLPRVDLAALPEEARHPEARRLTAAEAAAPFDLAAGPLLRTTLLRLREDEHLLLLTVHHIVADGWSVGILIREMGTLFAAHASGQPSPLPELPIQYADFALWQRGRLSGASLEREIRFWSERLRDAPPELALPTDLPRPAVLSERGASRRLRLSPELAEGVRALALRAGATPFMVLLAAFQVLLSRLSGQNDLTVGTPVAGRQRAEVENLIGFFVNTLVLRAGLAGAPPFTDFLARTRRHALEAYVHQELPFEKLVEHLQPGRHLGRNPLFQVFFALQNQPWPEMRLAGLRISPVEVDSGTAKADLNLVWHESERAYEAVLEYSTDLFESATAGRVLRSMATLLGAAVLDPAAGVRELPLLDAAERAAVLDLARGLRTPYPRAATIHGLVREQVRRSPGAVAVEMGGERLTYAELDARANRLAHRLLALGVRPDDRVGLAGERSAGLVAGMLGILAAGGAYVPLDLSYPQEHLDWMIEDAGIAALVHDGSWQGSAAVPAVDLGDAALAGESPDAPATDVTAGHLAYVIYTSGSTGRSKGVAVPHRAVVRLLVESDYVRLEPSDRVAQASNASFDAATFEVWGALFAGARLVVVPREEVLSPEALAARLAGDGITTLFLTTALFNQMARLAPGAFRGLRHLLFGGEMVDPGAVREVLSQGPPDRLLHVYGPTETTTFATWHQVTELSAQTVKVPIGRPLANSTAWVVDESFEPAPPGMPGELLLGGDGLARGYWERAELTAERFVPHPWSDQPGDRLYRSGDLVRLGGLDGERAIEFLGRIDQQVKIRGFRIEPGEIEAALATHPDVAECSVVVLGSSGEDRRLVAWLAPREGAALEPAALRAWLAARLPAYMVPAVFAPLSALPLTANGKVDRRALALLQPPAADTRGGAPETPVELRIAAVWSDLLRQPRIGRDDDFFELGGHSLLATQVVSRLRDHLGVEIVVRDLFEERTLAGLARRIEGVLRAERPAARPAAPPLRPVGRGGRLPLSFAQERLWFLEQLEPGSAFYNIPLASRLTGPLRIEALRQGIAELVRRHESLRTTFGDVQGRPFQILSAAALASVPLVDLSGLPGPLRDAEMRRQVAEESRRPFDLAHGPLFRIPLLRLGPEDHVLVPTMHHIISDGWSMTVLLREIAALYAAFSAGRPPALPELPVQYADYAVWQRGYLQGEELKSRLSWWRERLTGAQGLQLPTDRPRPPVETFRGRQRLVALSAGLTRRLNELGAREGVTLFMTLLAVFQTLLLRVTGQTDLPVGSPIANRYRSELEGVIGFFANTLVLRTDLSGNPSFRELLRRVREVTLGAYAHEDVPFEKLVEELQPERDMSRNPLFQVMCVLQNQPWPEAPMGEVEISSLPVDSGTAKFDLTLFWREDGGILSGMLEHNTDLFDDSTAWRLYRHHEALLSAALDDPEARVGALPLLDAAERHQILREWNDAGSDGVWAGRCVHHQVEEQAARTPGALAVIDGGRTLTYAELDARANRLARGLARRGVRPEALAGICVERSLEMVVAALAVLKAGGALVALDPAYPRERLAAILDDARLAVLLTEESMLRHFPEHQGIAFCLERGDDPFPEESAESPGVAVDPDHPIYAIYTSGSTGQPKGIVVTHRAFSNLLAWQLGDPGLRPGGRTVQFATFGFCVSFQEMLSSWGSGGTLVLADEMTRRDLPRLAAFLDEHGIDRLHLPFAALKHLAEAASGQRLPARLKTVITAGEQLQVTPAVRSLFDRLPGCTLANQYGASETHVVTALTLEGDPAGWPAIPPVGRPVDNVGIHLLDAGMEPVPIGVAGELYAGGACPPRCYLNDPALTASKLVPDPFGGVPGARLYRTGDAARYLADGRIEYHGRIDTQVKIRGFRVELGEIETVLARHPGVRDAAVVARPGHDGQQRLVAYVVPAGESGSLFDDLRTHLKQKLPEHMLPSAFVEMPALPVNANGKLDQAALPEPEVGNTREQEYVAPRTPIEELVAGIWAEVLGLDRVGVGSDFFELGGHSLLATQVVARMRQTLGVDVGVRALFEARTVAELTLTVAERLLDLADAEAALEAFAAADGEPVAAVASGRSERG